MVQSAVVPAEAQAIPVLLVGPEQVAETLMVAPAQVLLALAQNMVARAVVAPQVSHRHLAQAVALSMVRAVVGLGRLFPVVTTSVLLVWGV